MNDFLFRDCISCINDSAVSDIVHVNYEDRERLGINDVHADVGIMISDVVPIADMEIEISGKNIKPIVARTVVFPEFSNHFNEVKGKEAYVLALVITLMSELDRERKRVLVPVFADAKGKLVIFEGERMRWVIDRDGELLDMIRPREEIIQGIVGEVLRWWYFIQVCLTNPPIKERFTSLSKLEARYRKNTRTKKRNPVRYVRTHYLDAEELGIIRKSESGRIYTCLAWYVIGHWREYKNGHRVFIKPYWKGTMRNNIKEAGDVSRNRVVAQIGETIV